MIELPATQSTTLQEDASTTPGSESPLIRVDGTASAKNYALLDVDRGVEIGDGSEALESILHLFKGAAWPAGTHTLTIEAADSAWDASTETWATKPSAASGAPTVTAVVPAAGAVGDEFTVDVSTIISWSVDAADTEWYGLILRLDTSNEATFFGAFADPDYRPYIAVDDAYPLEEPSEPQPSDGRAVSALKPNFTYSVNDPLGEEFVTGINFQLDTVDDFETPDYDSGRVAHDEAAFDSASPPAGSAAFSNLVAGTTYYHRAEFRNTSQQWSGWSEPAEFTVALKGSIALSAPTIASGEIASPVPTVTAAHTPASTEALETYGFEIEVLNGSIWETHYEVPEHAHSTLSFTVPDDDALEYGKTYRIHAFATDDVEREDMAGDRAYLEVTSDEFTVAD